MAAENLLVEIVGVVVVKDGGTVVFVAATAAGPAAVSRW